MLKFIFFAVFISAGTLLLFGIGPERIVDFIGVERGYLLIFFLALIGVSFLTSASFYATLAALASTGEFNPILLGLAAAPALALGDSLFFFLGYHGRSLLAERMAGRFFKWTQKHPKWLAPLFAYLYTGLTPLPQDFLMAGLGLGGIAFPRILVAILLGNATFVAIISFLAAGGSF